MIRQLYCHKSCITILPSVPQAGPDSAAAASGGGGGDGDAAFSALMSSLTEEMAKTEVEGADDPLAKTLADLSKNLSSDAEKVRLCDVGGC